MGLMNQHQGRVKEKPLLFLLGFPTNSARSRWDAIYLLMLFTTIIPFLIIQLLRRPGDYYYCTVPWQVYALMPYLQLLLITGSVGTWLLWWHQSPKQISIDLQTESSVSEPNLVRPYWVMVRTVYWLCSLLFIILGVPQPIRVLTCFV